MNDRQLEKMLHSLEARIVKLELSYGEKKKAAKAHRRKSRASLTDHIVSLRDAGFFSQPKISEDVQKKLQGVYHCKLDRISMALLRLAKHRELRRTTKSANGKSYQAYVY